MRAGVPQCIKMPLSDGSSAAGQVVFQSNLYDPMTTLIKFMRKIQRADVGEHMDSKEKLEDGGSIDEDSNISFLRLHAKLPTYTGRLATD